MWNEATSLRNSPARAVAGTPPDWGITPTLGFSARPSTAGSRPRTRTVPASARRNPSQISIVVVLPAPLGPSSAVTAPRAALSDRPSTAFAVP